MVEQRSPKPRAEGSSPSAPAKKPAKTLGFRRFPFFMCCIAIWCILVRISGFPTRPYRLHPSPAPKTHPVSPFSGFSGCVSLFFPLLTCKISRIFFVHFAMWLLKIEVIGDTTQTGCVLFNIIQFCDLAGAVAQQVCYLPGRERFDGAVLLLDTIHQAGSEGVSE